MTVSFVAAAPVLPPVVPGSFLLGSTLDLRRDMLAVCEQSRAEYGDAVRFRVGPPVYGASCTCSPTPTRRAACWPERPRTTARTTSSLPKFGASSATDC